MEDLFELKPLILPVEIEVQAPPSPALAPAPVIIAEFVAPVAATATSIPKVASKRAIKPRTPLQTIAPPNAKIPTKVTPKVTPRVTSKVTTKVTPKVT